MSEKICPGEKQKFFKKFNEERKLNFPTMITTMLAQTNTVKIPMIIYRIEGPWGVFFKGIINDYGAQLLFSGKDHIYFPKTVVSSENMEELFQDPSQQVYFSVETQFNRDTNLSAVDFKFELK